MACTERDPMCKQRHFDDEIILLCVRGYISYKLSYRDLTEMMFERGLAMAPSTIYRWVQYYVPEFERRWNRFSRPRGNIVASRRDVCEYQRRVALPVSRGG